ncbi:hypothetical protein [Streptomyces sp. NPDC015242]|uniref:hypothetical protein n=1 Tax=Streptomyces sp. NPDC015242 TaxID=3364951 RepID=UPI0036F9AB89
MRRTLEAAPAVSGRSPTGRQGLAARVRVAGGSAAQWLERAGWDLVPVEEDRDTSGGAYSTQRDRTALGAPAPQATQGTVSGASVPATGTKTAPESPTPADSRLQSPANSNPLRGRQ